MDTDAINEIEDPSYWGHPDFGMWIQVGYAMFFYIFLYFPIFFS